MTRLKRFFLLTLLVSPLCSVYADSTIDTSAYSLTIPVFFLLFLLALLSVYFGFKSLGALYSGDPAPLAKIKNFRTNVMSAGTLLLVILFYVIGTVYFHYDRFSFSNSLIGYLAIGYRIGRPTFLLIINFIAMLVITVLVEASVAFGLGIREVKTQKALLFVNFITNPLLNFALLGYGLFSALVKLFGANTFAFVMTYLNPFYFLLFMEIIVVVTEYMLIKPLISNSIRIFLKVLLINLMSFVYGLLLSQIIEDAVYMFPILLERANQGVL